MSSTGKGICVYVGNLTKEVTKFDLEDQFARFGKIISIWLAFNPPGFAFIKYEMRSDAIQACNELHGLSLMGSRLRVEISKGSSNQNEGRNTNNGGTRDRNGGPNRDSRRHIQQGNRNGPIGQGRGRSFRGSRRGGRGGPRAGRVGRPNRNKSFF